MSDLIGDLSRQVGDRKQFEALKAEVVQMAMEAREALDNDPEACRRLWEMLKEARGITDEQVAEWDRKRREREAGDGA